MRRKRRAGIEVVQRKGDEAGEWEGKKGPMRGSGEEEKEGRDRGVLDRGVRTEKRVRRGEEEA